MIELIIAAVIARKDNLRPDRHPSFAIAGPTLSWKTSMARYLCYLLGIDPVKTIVNMAAESGLSLWLRKTSSGAVAYRRELLDSPLAVFDEVQKADRDGKRRLEVWTSGTKRVAFENQEETVEAVSLLILNPHEGDSPRARLGMDEPQLRRRIPLDLSRIRMPDLATRGEEAVEAAKKLGPLQLPKPRYDCADQKQSIFELLAKTLNEDGRKFCDYETIVMLCRAMTAFVELMDAIRLVLYDCLLLYETLGWTRQGWEAHVSTFPRPVPTTTALDLAPEREMIPDTIPQETIVRAFRLLDTGASASELVTEFGLTYDESKQVLKMYSDLGNILRKDTKTKEDPEIKELQRDVQIAKLEREKYEATAPIETSKELATLMANMAIIQDGGRERMKVCGYFNVDHCDQYGWKDKPADGLPPGEVFFKDGWWVMRPDPITCAGCSMFLHPSVVMEYQLDEKAHELSQGLSTVQSSLDNTPAHSLRNRFTCKCGSKGLVAVRIKCTKCGSEDWWGWHPP